MTTKSESLTEVGIREFRSHMSTYMERVKEGETIVLTDRGKPVGRVVPEPEAAAHEPETVEDKIWKMVHEGKASWNGQRFMPRKPTVKAPPGFSLSDLIIQERQEADDALWEAIHR